MNETLESNQDYHTISHKVNKSVTFTIPDEDENNDNNIKKVWKNLKDKENKSGQFRTIIAADIKGKKSLFEGIIRGTLIDEKRGEGGFGYDPIFVPTGHSKTFAELEKKVKNTISHRAKAFIFFIKDLNSAI